MSYPRGRINWLPLPGESAHVVFATAEGVPLLCGRIHLEWLVNVPAKGHSADVMLCFVDDCDHGGTRREPRSLWTGEPTP